ncbi:hypothetical protein Tco_1114199 [Tanacetum coccineum]|uniref:Reverse transcriptase domain-containing protein n=1 Tax=Tanacetum coccineum TaxID=301880 RepID=A0ABQ5IVG2_9ASTR
MLEESRPCKLNIVHNQRSRIDVITTVDNVEVSGNFVADVFVSHYQSFLGTDLTCEDLDSAGLLGSGCPELCNAIRDIFDNGKRLKEINHTFIALIPKVTTPRKELMHNYHRDRGPPRCAFKVAIQKAYDTVDWRINGDIYSYFKGKRGLRQGDPLSPYLFTLVMEILTLILQRRVRMSDSGDVESAKVVMESLNEFKNVSRLVPSNLPEKYLGVPLISSRLLNKDCKVLVEKARNQIGDWKNKALSFFWVKGYPGKVY